MKIVHWKYENVNEDGICYDGGSVYTDMGIRFSTKAGNCGLKCCHCSDGHWVCFGIPRTEDGTVEGSTIYFDNEIQLNKFIDLFQTAISNRG
jgi:hypothetical protein